jgi:hypothetical protein
MQPLISGSLLNLAAPSLLLHLQFATPFFATAPWHIIAEI